ncbi:MAG TPA: citrate lyase acyl carrier protein [Clostridium sp.]|jgi:citrate lyase subunit gamma (acyl carrier protein)|uniref:citrate lyase acyl carrier protein n=1 Tax=unclassified Clostridium TaxID=2614128 RepID=UPI000EBE3A41|nr:citrate lyase acyl carrier protein [Clostridium sp.]
MVINKISKAGTLESNDIYVIIMPNEEGGIAIELESMVMKQFGAEIEKAIRETLEALEVKDAIVKAQDKGALDYTIRARVETAVKRAQ